jgi:hypothetical protein
MQALKTTSVIQLTRKLLRLINQDSYLSGTCHIHACYVESMLLSILISKWVFRRGTFGWVHRYLHDGSACQDKDFFTPNLSNEKLKRDKSPKSNLRSRHQLGTAAALSDWPRASGEVTTPGTNWLLVSGLFPDAP